MDLLITHIKENQLASMQQHGFTGGKSTVTNLLEALNIWTEALMHDLPLDVIYLDYAKAFDSVPHQRLLKQLESLGLTNKALKWIAAFLEGRRQKVIVNGAESEWREVLSGVPQGSVLGPILFTMFVCDIPGSISSLASMFADDTKIYTALTAPNTRKHYRKI